MRIAVIVLAALLLAPVAAGATVRTVTAPGAVTGLAFDGSRVAYASGPSARDCDRVRVWNLRTRSIIRLGRTTACVRTSTGTGIAALAIAGSRVLWLHYTGGNIREWSLFTATETAPKPRRLRFVARDVDAPPPIVVGDGDSGRLRDILPYAVGRDVVALRTNGSRRFAWTAPARVVALSALAGRLAVAQEGGTVTVLDAGGRVVREERFAGAISAVKLNGNGWIVAQHGRTLESRDDAGGAWSTILPAGARLVDVASEVDAFYVVRGEVHARRLGAPRDVVVARGSRAQAEGLTLATASGRTVTAREPYAS